MLILLVNLNMNALYQTSLLNPEASCHAETVEMSCCEIETEAMSETECSLTKWIGVQQISSCTCLHELNEQSSVILSQDTSNSKITGKNQFTYNYQTDSKNRSITFFHSAENSKYTSPKIYLIDSSLLI